MEESKFYTNENSNKIWYLPSKGKHWLHRHNGPAIEWKDGSTWWYINRKQHREDGPAVELASGTKVWYLNNQLHRLDGPAIEYADRSKEWWFNGKQLPTKQVETWIEENKINLKTEAGQIAFKLRWM